jgi:hypothetical protein
MQNGPWLLGGWVALLAGCGSPPAATPPILAARAAACTEQACYRDGDGDGWGGGAPVLACVCPVGWVARGGDCDEGSAARWQWLDCYADGDGDHYGAGASSSVCAGLSCADGVSGWAESAGDCNDADASVHPVNLERSNGIDDDCDGAVDEAALTFQSPIYWIVQPRSSSHRSSFTVYLTLAQTAESDALRAGTLQAQIYYRPLTRASQPYDVIGPTPVVMLSGSEYGSVVVDGVTPLTAYEVRIDLYRGGTRIVPGNGCSGDAGSDPPCSNSDVLYWLSPPAASDGWPAARQEIVQAALGEWNRLPYEMLGTWDGSLQQHYGAATSTARYSSEFYAWSAETTLRDMNPCRDDGDWPEACPGETSPAENSVARLTAWFAQYPGALATPTGSVDFGALKPGDWIAADSTPATPGGDQSRMFLAYDAAADRYWFVEGDGTFDAGWGRVAHVLRVGSDAHAERIGTIGKLGDPAMLDSGN